jgi:hypothetical protein
LKNGDKNFGVRFSQKNLETRTSGSKQVWELLHNACNEDESTALALIEAGEL